MPSDLITQLEEVLLLILSAVLGGVVGAQPEHHGSPAGIRTHLLVSFGSGTVVALYIFLAKRWLR